MANKIAAAEAVKAFRGRNIQVQTAERAVVKGGDGRDRPAFKTSMTSLRAEHVIGASESDGTVTIVTIDGKRHSATAAPAAGKGDAA